jgi:hypothetical protein
VHDDDASDADLPAFIAKLFQGARALRVSAEPGAQTTVQPKLLYSSAEVAALLAVRVRVVNKLAREGELLPIMVHSGRRFLAVDVFEFLQRKRATSSRRGT